MPSSDRPTPSSSGLSRRVADFRTLPDALDYAAGGRSGINVYSGRGVLTEALPYRDLAEQARLQARRLLGSGLRPGDRVVLVAENDGDFVRLFFACQYAGLVPVPLPLPAAFAGSDVYVASLRRMIVASDAAACFAPELLRAYLEQAVDGLDMRLVGTDADLASVPPATAPLPAPDPAALSYLQFSSGSTRLPLGVAVTQAAVMANVAAIGMHGLGTRDEDRATSWLPFYHDMGLVGFLLAPMASQISIDLLPTREFSRRPLVWLELISRNRGTLAYSPSFGYELCARKAANAPESLDLGSWRVAGIGGDIIRPQALEAFADGFAGRGFRRQAFVASYGMAEATLALSFAPLDAGIRTDTVTRDALEHRRTAIEADGADGRVFVRCGRVLPGHELEVRDEGGQRLPERRVGTIFVRGPSVMRGYFGHEEETAVVLRPDGWLDTGDLGYLVDDEIVVTGRAKDLMIVNGRNVWPQDLEWAAETEIDGLRSRDVVVFSVETGTAENVVALVQCRAAAAGDREALRLEAAAVFRRRYGVEVSVVLVPPHSLPQTSSGKLSRTRARHMLMSGAFDTAASGA